MRIIIDIQGFKVADKFLAKELAVYDGLKISHFIFKPPFPLSHLSPDNLKQAKWLMKNHHCIDWNEGFIPYHKFGDIVRTLTSRAEHVYVKGEEKAEIIRKYSVKSVYEFDEQPSLVPMDASCFYHSNTLCICALSNVYFLHNHFFMQ